MKHFDHLKVTYFEECAELLDAAYFHFSALDEGRADNDTVHAIFRAIHSIKGGGGAFGFDRLVGFAHVMETDLDLLRDGKLAVTPALTALLVRATDALGDLIAAARDGSETATGFEDALMAELHEAAAPALEHIGVATAPPGHHLVPGSAPLPMPEQASWRIRFVPRGDLFRHANEPLLILRELQRLGTLQVVADLSRLPDLAVLDPEEAYIGWTLTLETAAPRDAIEDAFVFVSDDCELSLAPHTPVSQAGVPPPPLLETSAPTVVAPPADGQPVAAYVAATPAPEAARPAADGVPTPSRSIRIDVDKIDRLVNLVGELVINQAMLRQLGDTLPPEMCGALLNGLETMSQHLRELQEGVMAIRAQPVKSVFARMPRLVRELSVQLGKQTRLVLSGEGTEIDKTVIEQLADPLTHLLRNALDHGIEPPAEREAAGKPRVGTIHLGAEHRSGRIVIEVSDDGRGIPREKVLAKAQARGLVPADAVFNDEEMDNLIFLPGLSTAETLTDISGRGVGMDVVRRNIQALGGRITVDSRAGAGSRFLLSLPLTLAILDGMAVAVGRETYIIPLTNIMESLRPKRAHLHAVVGRGDVLAIRGAYVPLIYLHRHFSVGEAVNDPCRGIVVIVESEDTGRVGLVVDDLLGQLQVVVKSLEANYGSVDGIGGATILGDGRVALILDVNRLHGGTPMSRALDRVPEAALN